ncbi:hypothetical protein [Terrisporobacter vanillatitrophus]|uniref:hypothetical protein n=1 Tax=Terrisporobacter vanillatitrophus TaxID=3058402 RepID=UPI003369A87E
MSKKVIENSKLNPFELMILLYLLLQPLLLKWAIDKSFIKYIQIILLAYFILRLVKTKQICKSTIIVNAISIILILINLLKFGIGEYYYFNLIICGFGNIMILVFLGNLIKNKRKNIISQIIKIFYVFSNCYFIINIPIILKQLEKTYFMFRFHEMNPMYEDHITGLIGSSGTHRLTFFWISLIVVNIYMYNKIKKKLLLIYMALQVCFMVFISSQNDNTAFFLIFPIIIIQILVLLVDKINFKLIIKIICSFSIISVITITLFNSNEEIKEFFNNRVLEKIYQYTNNADKHNSNIKNKEERIELFEYALEHGDGYKLGKGIGSVTYSDKSMPIHFGMSEISIKTYEGGLIYLIWLILIYAYYSYKIILYTDNFSDKKKRIIFVILLLDFILFSTYTQIFSTSEILIFWGITLLIFTMINNEDNKKAGILNNVYSK